MFLINRNFALLWGGQLVSQLGDKIYSIALLWWLLEKTASPLFTSSFLILAMLPEMLLAPLAGVYVDRWNKKHILVATDLARGAIVLALAALYHLQALQIWQVCLAALAISLCSALANPAILALIPSLVEREALQGANARSQLVGGVTRILGPLLGASSVAVAGYLPVLLFNAASYLLSGGAECLLRLGPTPPRTASPVWHSLKQGLRHMASDARIRAIVAIVALVHVFFGALIVILPFLARSLTGRGIANLGVLEAMLGLGIVAGAAALSGRVPAAIRLARFLPPILGMALAVFALGWLSQSHTTLLLPCALCCAAIGACVALLGTYWQTAIQDRVAEDMRGRVFSVLSSAGNVSLPISMGLTGLLLKVLPLATLLLAAGGALALAGLALARERGNGSA